MKNLIASVFSIIKNPSFWANLPKNIIIYFKKFTKVSYLFTSFFFLLVIYFTAEIFHVLAGIPLLGRLVRKFVEFWDKLAGKFIDKAINFLEARRPFQVKRSYLIYLAFENLRVRKSRSIVTIAGMSFGVGIIVLLLSLGYGIERLVISRVASLSELKVVDVSTGGSTAVKLNKSIIQRIHEVAKIDKAIPLVSIVGRITYNKATTDVLVYSTTNEYFDHVNNSNIKGRIFSKNKLSFDPPGEVVAGASTEFGEPTIGKEITRQEVSYNILPDLAAPVWDSCTTDGKILGFTARVEGKLYGREYWGSDYYPFEGDARAGYNTEKKEHLGKWMMGIIPLFAKNSDNSMRPVFDSGTQKWVKGCIKKADAQVFDEGKKVLGASVLGDATSSAELATTTTTSSDSASLSSLDFSSLEASDSGLFGFTASVVATDSAGIELVDLQAGSTVKKKETETLKFKGGSSGEAIVSTGLLNLLNIPVNKALSETFTASLIIGKSQIPEIDGKAQSEEATYKIIGVVDDAAQYFYVPFSDIEAIGVSNFSQVKIVLADQNEMDKIRKQIEDLGFNTASTADTIAQIELLFGNLRIVLGLLGMVALGVASLGMFNTLTVSLLERTREIGGMKTIGMVTDEVQELLLSEAMIMGFSGGIGGLILGWVVGKLLSVIVSIIAAAGGQGFLDITYVPPFLIIFILVSSFVVGVITGLYPAIRARRISALNALRYE